MIEVQHLTCRYGTHTAVEDLNFKIRNGHIYGLLGPKGSGKSTTMNLIAGCLAPTAGTVRINGYDPAEHPIEAKRQIGYLPEIPPLFPDMTPYEYLTFVAEIKGLRDEALERQVKEAMAVTSLGEVQDTLIRNLSRGVCRRVGIAQAMLGKPDILILDEPTAESDPAQLVEIRALIRKLGEKHTVILSGHDLGEIRELCDHVIILAHGKVVADDAMSELEARVTTDRALRLTVKGDGDKICEILSAIPGVQSVTRLFDYDGTVDLKVVTPSDTDLRDDIFYAMADHRFLVVSMEVIEQSLEDIFRALTGESAEEDPAEDAPDEDALADTIDEEVTD